jgi:uncharacterized membrane protein YphA (DoxX/SURF4 family)
MRRLFSRWEAFWFAEGPTLGLGVFRILFALTLVLEVGTNFEMQQNAVAGGGFHHPYAGFLPPPSERLYWLLHVVQWPASLLLAFGVAPRTACAVLLSAEGWVFFADRLAFRNHTYLSLLLTGLLLVSPCARSLSLASLFRGRRAARSENAPLTAQRLIQFQISALYFWSAINKLAPGFASGSVMAVAIGEKGLASGASGAILGALLPPETLARVVEAASRPENMVPGAYATIALELFLAFALWWRRTRPAAILLGVAFHAIIGISMDIGTFGLIATSSYVLFVEPGRLERLRARLLGRELPPPGSDSEETPCSSRRSRPSSPTAS